MSSQGGNWSRVTVESKLIINWRVGYNIGSTNFWELRNWSKSAGKLQFLRTSANNNNNCKRHSIIFILFLFDTSPEIIGKETQLFLYNFCLTLRLKTSSFLIFLLRFLSSVRKWVGPMLCSTLQFRNKQTNAPKTSVDLKNIFGS